MIFWPIVVYVLDIQEGEIGVDHVKIVASMSPSRGDHVKIVASIAITSINPFGLG